MDNNDPRIISMGDDPSDYSQYLSSSDDASHESAAGHSEGINHESGAGIAYHESGAADAGSASPADGAGAGYSVRIPNAADYSGRDPQPDRSQFKPSQYHSDQPRQSQTYSEPDTSSDEPEEPVSAAPLNVKPIDDHRYVTKGALALCLVLTMIVSSVLGAVFGSMFSRNQYGSGTPRNDSELSQLNLSDATGSELTISQIVDKNENAVVEILVSATTQDYFGQQKVAEGAGSGVIINEKGYIVTNYHVIQGANKVQVTLHNGETYPATIVGGDNDNDIAVIKINAENLTVAEIGDSDTVDVGDTAVAIGNPLGQLGGTATTGIISALDRRLTIDGRTLNLLQTDAAINGGNSGGGLFNSKGELIGIVDAKSSGVGIEGLAFAIPINSVSSIINDLVENGKVRSKPAVGVTITEVSDDNAQYYGLEGAGVYIAEVTGENAKKAGFQQGDRIVSFNGEEITSSSDFIQRVRSCKIGDIVTVVVSRSGQNIEIKTELEELVTTQE